MQNQRVHKTIYAFLINIYGNISEYSSKSKDCPIPSLLQCNSMENVKDKTQNKIRKLNKI